MFLFQSENKEITVPKKSLFFQHQIFSDSDDKSFHENKVPKKFGKAQFALESIVKI
jgi:hypothetical protein